MIDILVFSHSCLRRVNRLVYEEMISKYGLNIHIVVPQYFVSNNKKIDPDQPKQTDKASIHKLILKGNNPRNYYFDGTKEVLKKLDPKIVIIDADPASYSSIKLALLKKKNNFKLVALTCENQSIGLIDNYRRRGIKGALLSLPKIVLAKFSVSRIDHLFTINDLGTKIYSQFGFKNISKIPLGYSQEVFFVDPKKRERIRTDFDINDKIVFIYVGRIVKEKGIHILLEALSKLSQYNNWTLLLDEFSDANNSYIDNIKDQIIQLDLSERIIFFNASHSEIAGYINAADIVVMPSISTKLWIEQYGRVAPESLACGKLVIASNTGALPELIGDAGIIVEEGNVLKLSEALEECVKGKISAKNFEIKAVQRADNLSIQKQAESMFSIVNKFINESKS